MKLKRLYILSFFLFALAIVKAQETPDAVSQPTPPREKLQAYKIGFITHRLDLTPAEAEKFWPIFNQYQNEMTELFNQRKAARNAGTVASGTQLEYDQKVLDIRKKYYDEFKKVLPPEKVTKLYKAEHDFKIHVIKQVAAHKEGNAHSNKMHRNPLPRPHIQPGVK